jgi:DNA-binding IclR family transcriptional regulator
VHRAIDILESFSVDRPSLTLGQICDAVQLTLPTTYRLLKALQHKDMVTWDPLSKRYSLGIGVMRLASLILNRDDLTQIVLPWLELLRGETRETVALHGVIDGQRVCLMEMVSALPIRMASGVGTAYPLYRGAAGKAMLAWMPPDRVSQILDTAVEAQEITVRRREELHQELDGIRRVGFATSRGETVSSAAALAAPILNVQGDVVGAINITGPADRLTPARIQKFSPRLLHVCASVMRQLGAETMPQTLEQQRGAQEALQRQARERLDRDREQIEEDLRRQQERDGGIER